MNVKHSVLVSLLTGASLPIVATFVVGGLLASQYTSMLSKSPAFGTDTQTIVNAMNTNSPSVLCFTDEEFPAFTASNGLATV
jgi:hypothetical protein